MYFVTAPFLLALIVGSTACSQTYSAQYLIEVQVNAENLDPLVEAVLEELGSRGFSVRNVGAEHRLAKDSAAVRRLFETVHPSGIRVGLNNFFHPEVLDIGFYLMDSTNIRELSATHTVVVERLRAGRFRFREVSEAERDGRLAQ